MEPTGWVAQEVDFELIPGNWVRGVVTHTFSHRNTDLICTIMCVILKITDHTLGDGIYHVRSIGQCRGWR